MTSVTTSCASSLKLDDDAFVSLLRSLIGHVKNLQNCPPEMIPKEELVADEILKVLSDVTNDNNSNNNNEKLLEVNKLTYVENRSNVIMKYPSQINKEKCVCIRAYYV
tara:strand:- start:7 stop:330 length:324 start_codon:yes stop_codon:yes gene_type:complete